MFYTYSHSKPDGAIFYIGKGIGNRAWSKDNRNIHWKRTVAKYGYTVELVAHWDDEESAFDHEKLLICCLKDLGCKLVNLTPGGEGSAGYRWTDDQKANFDITGEKNGMHGKKHSEETRQKIREKALGRKTSDETRYKISEKMKIRVFSNAHIDNLRKGGIGNKNGLGNIGGGRKCEINGVVYVAATIAARELGLGVSAVQKRCLNPKYPTFNYLD